MRKGFVPILIVLTIIIVAITTTFGAYYSQKSKSQNQTITQQNPEQSRANTPNQLLISVNVHGGLCPAGECSTITEIKRDGTVLIDGKTKEILDNTQITKLANLVDTQDYTTLKKLKSSQAPVQQPMTVRK